MARDTNGYRSLSRFKKHLLESWLGGLLPIVFEKEVVRKRKMTNVVDV
jgi:hypothetical protein